MPRQRYWDMQFPWAKPNVQRTFFEMLNYWLLLILFWEYQFFKRFLKRIEPLVLQRPLELGMLWSCGVWWGYFLGSRFLLVWRRDHGLSSLLRWSVLLFQVLRSYSFACHFFLKALWLDWRYRTLMIISFLYCTPFCDSNQIRWQMEGLFVSLCWAKCLGAGRI